MQQAYSLEQNVQNTSLRNLRLNKGNITQNSLYSNGQLSSTVEMESNEGPVVGAVIGGFLGLILGAATGLLGLAIAGALLGGLAGYGIEQTEAYSLRHSNYFNQRTSNSLSQSYKTINEELGNVNRTTNEKLKNLYSLGTELKETFSKYDLKEVRRFISEYFSSKRINEDVDIEELKESLITYVEKKLQQKGGEDQDNHEVESDLEGIVNSEKTTDKNNRPVINYSFEEVGEVLEESQIDSDKKYDEGDDVSEKAEVTSKETADIAEGDGGE
jgi:hypothetical protein